MPWQVLNSPLRQWEAMPSFLLGELLFIACAFLALWHAHRQPGPERRRHLTAWLGALVAGTANDAIFMALPLVDNFWQAQATVMLTPRMPLYIPCVYVWFMYLPAVAVWRLRLPPLSRAAASGLLAAVVYAPYDIVGAKYLWWTWHDTDPPISNRLLGAPIGSTMWVITFVATFAWLLGRVLDRDGEVSLRTSARAVAVVAAFSTVIMVLQLTVLQQLDGGVPGVRGLVVVTALYAALVLHGLRRRGTRAVAAPDAVLRGAAWAYFATLAAVVALFDPATHRSTSVHQTVGPCGVEERDITGLSRHKFLCVTDYDEDFSFDCAPPPADGTRWYTVCGRPHVARGLWLGVVLGLGLCGAAACGALLSPKDGHA